jgi:hypothetical protein
LTLDIVGLDKGLEYWESMSYILDVVESVDVNTCDFDFISGASTVNQVSEAGHFFLARYTTWRDCTGSLLHGKLLVVFVDSKLLVKSVWAILVT